MELQSGVKTVAHAVFLGTIDSYTGSEGLILTFFRSEMSEIRNELKS